MANSDYTVRSNTSGFCPHAVLAYSIDPLQTVIVMSGYTSPISNGIRIGMAAMIGDEIVSIDAQSGDNLTIGRGCCDTIPRQHAAGTSIWFFDDSIGSDYTEYTAAESIGVKLLPRTATGGAVPVEAAPAQGITFNWRFARPYPPGAVRVNGAPWFGSSFSMAPGGVESLVFTWAHRDRVTQADQLIPHGAASIGPEAGVTYSVIVRRYSDGVVLRTVTGITGTTWTYTLAMLVADIGSSAVVNLISFELSSVRGSLVSLRSYTVSIGAQSAIADPHFAQVALLLNFEGANGSTAIVDSSSHADNKTANANQQVSTNHSFYGGSSLRVTSASPAPISWTGLRFQRTVRALTVEGRHKSVSSFNGTEVPPVFRLFDNAGAQLIHVAKLGLNNTLSVRFGTETTQNINYTPDANGWVHWEIGVEEGGTARVFFNGVVVYTTTFMTLGAAGANCGVWVGGASLGSFNGVDQYIDGIRVTIGVCRHTSDFTPPTELPAF